MTDQREPNEATPATAGDAGRILFVAGLRVVAFTALLLCANSVIPLVVANLFATRIQGVFPSPATDELKLMGLEILGCVCLFICASAWAAAICRRLDATKACPEFRVDGVSLLRVGLILLGIYIASWAFTPLSWVSAAYRLDDPDVSPGSAIAEAAAYAIVGLGLAIGNGPIAARLTKGWTVDAGTESHDAA